MKGDFSRWTFDPTKHYSRVLSLQGRVFLDADFNEGQELGLQHLRKLTADLLGPHGGPGTAFEIDATQNPSADFVIRGGRYYVNGIVCENDADVNYLSLVPKPDPIAGGSYVAYLDVWERFVTFIEDEDLTTADLQQSIREVALGGPDTAARSEVVWQVRLLKFGALAAPPKNDDTSYREFLKELVNQSILRPDASKGMIKARARKPKTADQPCPTSPDSQYRGPENQLYRVEIHNPGVFPPAQAPAGGSKPSFKWSRENGSVVFSIRSLEGPTVTLETLGHDERLGLKVGDLVEVVDDTYVLQNRAEQLRMVKSIDPETYIVELDAAPVSNVGTVSTDHPILRRWEGYADVSRNADPLTDGYLALEQGVEVYFGDGDYRTGDYWITPARVPTGDVEWPGPPDDPQLEPPQGILHWYAPLAFLSVAAGGLVTVSSSMRRTINQLWS
jgi:hypothetical protein